MDLDAPGLGWTGIELLFTVLQCVASVQLLHGVQQGDAKAIEAFHFFWAISIRRFVVGVLILNDVKYSDNILYTVCIQYTYIISKCVLKYYNCIHHRPPPNTYMFRFDVF